MKINSEIARGKRNARYQGHGSLQLGKEERALLRRLGFEPWGQHAWVCFDETEQGGTCYDDIWAMCEALDKETSHA